MFKWENRLLNLTRQQKRILFVELRNTHQTQQQTLRFLMRHCSEWRRKI